MADDHDGELPAQIGFFHGVVVDNEDPLGLGRIRANVPGVAEPTGWAFPLAAARGPGVGFFSIPKRDAEVGVWFKQGDEDSAFYLPAHWPQTVALPSTVEAAAVEDRVDVHAWETDAWVLVLDDRAQRILAIRDKATGENVVEIDGVSQGVTIKGMVAVRIESLGEVQIRGTRVTINGRQVLPTTRPI